MKHSIHLTAEEKLAQNSHSGLSLAEQTNQKLDENTQAVKDLHTISKDRSETVLGFTGTIQKLNDVGTKLEEVKSASLITNKLLKDIHNKKTPEIPKVEFPAIQKVEFPGIDLITIKGKDGVDGKTPSNERIERLIRPLIPEVKDGKDYVLTEKDKKDIAKSIKVPIVEKIIEKTEVIKEQPIVTNEIKEVALYEEADPLVEKINTSTKRINAERVKGLAEVIRQVDQIGSNPMGKEAGGGGNVVRFLSNGVVVSAYVTEINFSTGITPTYAGNGRITLTAAGGSSTTYQETPSGLINGSNTTYTVLNSITTVLNFAINGQYIHRSEYTAVGTTITFVTAIDSSLSGTNFDIVYQ